MDRQDRKVVLDLGGRVIVVHPRAAGIQGSLMGTPRSLLAILLPFLVLSSCSSPTQTEPSATPPPGIATVRPSLAFGDPPLEGFLEVTPSPGETDWRFEADLDEDGRPDESGALGHGVLLSYSFEEPGVHLMRIAFERGDVQQAVDAPVVVNDLTATDIVSTVSFPDGLLGGVALDEDRNALYVADSRVPAIRILDPSTPLSSKSVIELPPLREGIPIQGVELSADRRTLFVDHGDTLIAIRLGDEPLVEHMSIGTAATRHLKVSPDGTLFLSGFDGLVRVDPAGDSTFLPLEGAGQLALSPDQGSLAVLQWPVGDPLPRVRLFDVPDLASRWSTTLPVPQFPRAVVFGPAGQRLYVLAGFAEFHLLVLDSVTGKVLSELVLARGIDSERFQFGVSSPAERSTNGRFVVFGTGLGAFFIDTRTDLPAFRTEMGEPGQSPGCCDVVASSRGDEFFFSSPSGAVSKIAVRR